MYAFNVNGKKKQRTWQSRYDRLLLYTRDLERYVLDVRKWNAEYDRAPSWLRRLFSFILNIIER